MRLRRTPRDGEIGGFIQLSLAIDGAEIEQLWVLEEFYRARGAVCTGAIAAPVTGQADRMRPQLVLRIRHDAQPVGA